MFRKDVIKGAIKDEIQVQYTRNVLEVRAFVHNKGAKTLYIILNIQ